MSATTGSYTSLNHRLAATTSDTGRPVERGGALASGVDRLMLKQQACVGDLASHPLRVYLPLDLPGPQVLDRIGASA